MPETMSRWVRRLETGMAWISVTLCGLIAVLTILEIALRAVGFSFFFASQLNGSLFALLIYFMLPDVTRRGDHIRIDFLSTGLGEKSKAVLASLLNITCAVFSLYLLYVMYHFVLSNFKNTVRSQDLLSLPVWYFQAPILLGIAVTALRFMLLAALPAEGAESQEQDLKGHI